MAGSSPYWQIRTLTLGLEDECVQGVLGGPLGTSVTQERCDPNVNYSQLWQPIGLGGDVYKFKNIATGMCLEARFGAVNAKPVALWFCDSTESNTR